MSEQGSGEGGSFFKKLFGGGEKKPKPVTVVPREAATGQTADEIVQEQLNKKPAERNSQLMRDAADATSASNAINHDIAEKAKASGLKTNNLQAEPVLDEEGNIKGFRVKN